MTDSYAAQLFVEAIQNSICIYDETRTLEVLYVCCESATAKEWYSGLDNTDKTSSPGLRQHGIES